ncbi:MAG: prolyl oligopeptidase family serine peptidase, partial [Gluconacetobacter diazotrophicus]|nr:prolyl oligopeptidase family serine peptidase [Gluconacetobacter diazotrophicus]
MMRRSTALSLLLVGLIAGPTLAFAQTPSPPPVAAVRPVVDEYFGTKVTDPYRWMEQPGGAEFAGWLKGQAEHTRLALERLPDRARLLERVLALGDASASVRSVQRAGGCFFFLRANPGEDNRKLFVRAEASPASDPGRLLLDPTRLGLEGKHVAIDYFLPSPDGKVVAVAYSEGGSENSVLHFLDVADGHDLGGSIDRCAVSQPSWQPDGRALFYTRQQGLAPGAPPTAKYLNGRTFLHALGTDPERDTPVLGRGLTDDKVEIGESDFPAVAVSPASPHALGLVIHGVRREVTLYTAPRSALDGARTPWRKLADVADDVTGFDLHGDELFLLSHHDASRFQVLRITLPNGTLRSAATLVPASEAVLEELHCAADALYVRTLDGGLGGVLRLPYAAGAKPTLLPLPFAGATQELTVDPLAAGVVFSLEGWVRSPTYLRYDPASGQVADTRLLPPSPLDFSGLEAVEVKARAADGTLVPLSIIARKGAVRDGSAPTLLIGYGAYGVSLEPSFDPTDLAWLERGGVLAFAHVRGGGEYGEDWHRAGQKLTKPNTWGDFIACAEYLVAEKWTSPAHLAGLGESAGGILVGRAITSRPDLFGAAIIGVGISNPVRLETTPNGPPNVPEFGTATEEEGFRGLYEMDALHHVVDGTAYPAVLLAAGINDPRVDPWQSGKMAARLQAATGSGKPVLLRVDYDDGHGFG